MKCKNYNKQLYQYLEGKLPKGMAMEIEKHLIECKVCEYTLLQLKEVDKLIETEKSEFKHDAFLSARIISKLTKSEPIHEPKYTLRYITITSLAAAGLIIGVLIGSLFTSSNELIEETSATTAYEQLADEYIPEVENNPYNLVTIENEITTKP